MTKRPIVRRSAASLAASITIHVLVVVALVHVVFRYPLGQLMGIREPEPQTERIQFVRVPPPPTESSGGGRKQTSTKPTESAPAPLQTPVVAPTEVPPPTPVDSSRAQAAGGHGTGLGVSGSEMATGVEPREPDRRIALEPGPITRAPRTKAQDVDSIVSLAIGIVRDSMEIVAGQRKPGDWTVKRKGGTWGWDQSGIRLGKFTIPQALLALLPLNVSANQSPIEARSAAWIRRDVLENGQRAISEDDFRAAVKRIRERKERERRQKLLADGAKDQPTQQP
ncbi:MAG TPA: hypothetical protein VFT29_00255 [Gemmatimonadaceae bacterium]|nr:hypothetical protein [Gemmatimonadaceae bacterium]